MPPAKKDAEPSKAPTRRATARPKSTEEWEGRLVEMAFEEAQRQIKGRTASSQVLVHYLRMGSTRSKLEEEKLNRENELLKARVEQLESGRNIEALMQNAIDAFRGYSGQTSVDEELPERRRRR